jgi:hypothetical protein
MNKYLQHPHPCVRCSYPTAPGFGRSVNRLKGDYEIQHTDGSIEYRDGYHCEACHSPSKAQERQQAEQALEPVSLNPSGRPMATGDFDTREALVENVLKDFNGKYKTGQWTRQNIADQNGISYSALTLLLRDAKAIQ